MSGGIDLKDFARYLDTQTQYPPNWDKMTDKQKEESDYQLYLTEVAKAYKASKVKATVEKMTVEPQEFIVSSEADILNRPSPKWLVADLIQENTICLFAGPGGIGKTFIGNSLARAIASGGPFFGKGTQQGKVIYVAAEGTAAFGDRVRAWNHSHPSLTVPADSITYVEQGVNLKDPASVETLATMVREGDYSLVILDTLSQLGYLENENNNAEVAQTFRAIKSIRDAREGTSVLVLDHTPVGGGKARGATSKRDNSDTVIMAIPVGENGTSGFTLSTKNDQGGKQKDGKEIEWHGFGLQPVLNSAIVVNNGGKRPLSPYWEKCLPLLQEGPQGTTALREAAGIKEDMRSAAGRRFGRELDHWVKDGLVIKEGGSTKPTFRLAEHVAVTLGSA